MKETIVTIDENAEVEIHTKGFKGTECKTETAALKKALGQVVQETATAEMNQSATHGNRASH